jgi:hypothetical protein
VIVIVSIVIRIKSGSNKHATDLPCSSSAILLSWLGISLVAVSLGGRFYGFYMYILVPIIAVLIALAFEHFRKMWPAMAPPTRWSLIIFMLVGFAVHLYSFRYSNFIAAVESTANSIQNSKQDLGGITSTPAFMVSRYAAEHTAKEDQIFVWGYQPCIYVLSGRNFATRYFSVALQTGFVWGTIQQLSGWGSDYYVTYPGSKPHTFKPSDTVKWIYPGSQEQLLQDLQNGPPELFIDGNVPGEWPFSDKYPIAGFPAFQEFLNSNYKFEKNVTGYRVYRRLKQLQSQSIAAVSNKAGWL